jgi:hypothetical protein
LRDDGVQQPAQAVAVKSEDFAITGRECVNVFIDCGANVGDGLLKMLNQTELIEGPVEHFRSGSFFTTVVAPYLEQGLAPDQWCMYGFEGNPKFTGYLRNITARFPNVKVFPETVLSDRDGFVTFNIESFGKVNDWGSSLLNITPRSRGQRRSAAKWGKKQFAVNATSVAFPRFLRAVAPPMDTPNRRVVVKMDIEGAEYLVFPRLLESGALCLATDYQVEFHGGQRKPVHIPRNYGAVVGRHIKDDCPLTRLGDATD